MTFHSEKGMECHHPNWLSLHHFSEGVGIPPTRVDFLLIFPVPHTEFQKLPRDPSFPSASLKLPSASHGWLSFTLLDPNIGQSLVESPKIEVDVLPLRDGRYRSRLLFILTILRPCWTLGDTGGAMGSRKFLPKNLVPEMAEPERPPPNAEVSRAWKKWIWSLQCEAPGHDSVQLVHITPISLWFMVLITN